MCSGLDVADPPIDFVKLSELMSVPACRVEGPDEVSEAVVQALNADSPRLVEVEVRHP